MKGFAEALERYRKLTVDGWRVEDVIIAHELEDAVRDSFRKRVRKDSARSKMEGDSEGLYQIAVGVYDGSAGAGDPGDIARGVVTSYVDLGMDLDKTRAFTRTCLFAIKC